MDSFLQGTMSTQSKFPIRMSVDFEVTVKPQSEHNGYKTGLSTAVEKARKVLEGILRKGNWRLDAAEKGVRLVEHEGSEGEVYLDSGRIYDRAWMWMKGRYIDHMYFDGRGDYSQREHEFLLARLSAAMGTLSGLQQGADDEEGYADLENVVRDVAMALTGKEITFVQKEEAAGHPCG